MTSVGQVTASTPVKGFHLKRGPAPSEGGSPPPIEQKGDVVDKTHEGPPCTELQLKEKIETYNHPQKKKGLFGCSPGIKGLFGLHPGDCSPGKDTAGNLLECCLVAVLSACACQASAPGPGA